MDISVPVACSARCLAMEDIEAAIQKLRQNLLDKYEKDVTEIRADFKRQEMDNLQRLEDKKNALLKELDDRLALVRQFPSVLDANEVVLYPYENRSEGWEGQVQVDSRTLFRLSKGKWKVLVMAKKLE